MRRQLLIVDDESAILRALDRFFTEQGYEVVIADNFISGMMVLDQGQTDCAVIDQRLADYDGIDLISHIQKNNLPTCSIIMTGFGSIESAVKAIKAGAFHYTTKPFELPDLANLVQKALEHFEAREEN